jgi:hypothetical protein
MTVYEAVLLGAAAVAASELIVRLPVLPQAQGLSAATRKSLATISSKRISDHWKERALPAYSARMMRCSLLFFVLLCLAVAPVAVIGFAAPGGLRQWLELLIAPSAIALLCGISIGYIVLRTRLKRG